VIVSAGEGGALQTRHRAHAAVVECIQPLAERRCQHPVLASLEQQVEHENAVQLAFAALDTSGSEREPKLWPKTHFHRQPNAAATDLSLCAIKSLSDNPYELMSTTNSQGCPYVTIVMYRNYDDDVTMTTNPSS
jgi:hypothetical protein